MPRAPLLACLLAGLALVGMHQALTRGPQPGPALASVTSPRSSMAAVPSACQAQGRRSVDPERLLVGERATMTLFAHVDCIGLGHPMHIVLVLDGSQSMGGT